MAKIKACMFCQKEFLTDGEVKKCEQGHRDREEITYVPILKTDLSLLAHYLMSGDRSVLTDRVSNSIIRYFRK